MTEQGQFAESMKKSMAEARAKKVDAENARRQALQTVTEAISMMSHEDRVEVLNGAVGFYSLARMDDPDDPPAPDPMRIIFAKLNKLAAVENARTDALERRIVELEKEWGRWRGFRPDQFIERLRRVSEQISLLEDGRPKTDKDWLEVVSQISDAMSRLDDHLNDSDAHLEKVAVDPDDDGPTF